MASALAHIAPDQRSEVRKRGLKTFRILVYPPKGRGKEKQKGPKDPESFSATSPATATARLGTPPPLPNTPSFYPEVLHSECPRIPEELRILHLLELSIQKSQHCLKTGDAGVKEMA